MTAKKNNLQLSGFLDQTPDIAFVSDFEGQFIAANRAFSSHFEIAIDDCIGKNHADIFCSRTVNSIHKNNEKVINTGQTHLFEETFRKDGKEWDLLSQKGIWHDESGTPKGIFCIAHDISERKRMERALRESEERYRRIIETASEGIMVVDAGLALTFANERAALILGFTEREMTGKSLTDFLDEDWRDIARAHVTRRSSIIENQIDFKFRCASGETMWAVVSSSPIYDKQGQFNGALIMILDITERKRAEQEARDTESRFRSMLEDVPNVSLQGYLADGTIKYWNKASEKLYGYTKEEALGKNIVELIIPPGLRNMAQDIIATGARTGKMPPPEEYELMRKDKSLVSVFSSHTVLLSPVHEPILFCLDIDMSERRQMQEALARRDKIREAMVRAAKTLLSNFPEDRDFNEVLSMLGMATEVSRVYVFENQIAENGDTISYQRYEWTATGIKPQIDNPNLSPVNLTANGFKRWVKLMGSGEIIHANVRNMPLGEQELLASQQILSVLVVPVFVNDEWWGFIGFDRCDHECEWSEPEIDALRSAADTLGAALRQKREQSERKKIEARFRSISRAAEDCIFIKDRDLNYIHANPAMCQLWEKSEGEIKQCSDEDIFGPEVAASIRELDLMVLAGKTVEEERECCKKGKNRIFHVIKSPVLDEDGEIIGICGIARDITETRQGEENLLFSERMAVVGTLAAGVAHQFNNLNSGILGYADLLLRDPRLHPDLQHGLKQILKAVLKSRDITWQMLRFGQTNCSERRFSCLNEIVQATVDLLERELLTQGIDIEVKIGSVAETFINEGEISQIILSFLINAQHALIDRKEKRILVETGKKEDMVFVRVEDSGCGIRPETMPRIFTPFYSEKGEHAMGETPQSRVRGTGLGLSVSNSVAIQHGGNITVESEPGNGSCFTLWLPICKKSIPPLTTTDNTIESFASDSRILVLDDDEGMRGVLKDILKLGRYREIITASDGNTALAVIQKTNIDVVLVDLQMPTMSGSDFLRKLLRTHPSRRPIPIVITGKTCSPCIEGSGDIPVFDTLFKPCKPNQLLDRVNAAIIQRRWNGSA